MAQQLLHGSEISSAFQQMHGVGVAEGVGADAIGETGAFGVLFENVIGCLAKEVEASVA